MSFKLSGLAFAFTAGVLSIFSPCSYALLPGYIGYYLGGRFSVGRALQGGAACTLGLITVFTVVGSLASLLGELVPQIIPLLDLVAGAFLILMGIVTFRQTNMPYISLPVNLSKREGLLGLYTFGVVYGLAGIGCSAPIFVSVLFYSLSKGLVFGVLSFVLYALGMGAPLILTTILLAQTKEYILGRIQRATEQIQKVSGAVLIAVGLYLFYYYYVTYV